MLGVLEEGESDGGGGKKLEMGGGGGGNVVEGVKDIGIW
jgi:hypothetical protein